MECKAQTKLILIIATIFGFCYAQNLIPLLQTTANDAELIGYYGVGLIERKPMRFSHGMNFKEFSMRKFNPCHAIIPPDVL